jgi:hypothetical protein
MSWAWSATYASTRASDRILTSQALAMTELQLADWRRHVFRLYATVRDQDHPAGAHHLGREGRDALFREHPRSPLSSSDPIRASEVAPGRQRQLDRVTRAGERQLKSQLRIVGPARKPGTTLLRRVGVVQLPAPLDSTLGVWWLDQYAGGLFLPVRDGTAGESSYGGGHYLLDTA